MLSENTAGNISNFVDAMKKEMEDTKMNQFEGYNAASLSQELIKEIQQLEQQMKNETSEDIIIIAYSQK